MRAADAVDLGMPTLLEQPEALACARICAALGLQFVELNMNLPCYQLGRFDEAALREARDEIGIYCTLHLDENLSICDFNPLVREAHVQTVLAAIALAKRHRMPILTMHLSNGVYFTLPQRRAFLFSAYINEYKAALRDFRDRCGDAIGGSGIRLCVENCGGFPAFAQEGIALLLESEAFGLTLDIGHSACAGDVDMPFVLARQDRLCHMHIHDALAGDCHLPLGQGALDIAAALDLARAQGCRAVVEVKTLEGLKQSVQAIRPASV